MRGPRVTIAALVALVAFCAVGLAALRNPHEIWASALFTAALALVLTATLGARRNRAWLGYAAFGWAYLALAFGPWVDAKTDSLLLPGQVASFAMNAVHGGTAPYEVVTPKGDVTTYYPNFVRTRPPWHIGAYQRAAHSLGAIAFGFLGALAATLTAKPEEAP